MHGVKESIISIIIIWQTLFDKTRKHDVITKDQQVARPGRHVLMRKTRF